MADAAETAPKAEAAEPVDPVTDALDFLDYELGDRAKALESAVNKDIEGGFKPHDEHIHHAQRALGKLTEARGSLTKARMALSDFEAISKSAGLAREIAEQQPEAEKEGAP